MPSSTHAAAALPADQLLLGKGRRRSEEGVQLPPLQARPPSLLDAERLTVHTAPSLEAGGDGAAGARLPRVLPPVRARSRDGGAEGIHGAQQRWTHWSQRGQHEGSATVAPATTAAADSAAGSLGFGSASLGEDPRPAAPPHAPGVWDYDVFVGGGVHQHGGERGGGVRRQRSVPGTVSAAKQGMSRRARQRRGVSSLAAARPGYMQPSTQHSILSSQPPRGLLGARDPTRAREEHSGYLPQASSSSNQAAFASMALEVDGAQRLSVLAVNSMRRDALWREAVDPAASLPPSVRALSAAEQQRRKVAAQPWHAAVWLQSRFRGARCRRVLWGPAGVCTQFAARRIQSMWRGSRGRARAAEARQLLRERSSSRIAGMLYVVRAKRTAMALQAAVWVRAALRLQGVARGMAGRAHAAELRRLLRLRMASEIERCYRGYGGREAVRRRCERREAAELRLLKAAAEGARGELLPRYEAAMVRHSAAEGVPPQGALGPAQAGAALRTVILEVALSLMCARAAYHKARLPLRDGRRLFPEDPLFAYLHALALLLAVEGIEGLPGTTRANAARLDGALDALETARQLDRVAFGERDTALEEVMEGWFEAALRVAPTDCNALLSVGLLAMFAPALTEKLRTPDPRWVPLKWRPLHFGAQAMRRARRYVDASMAGPGADRFHVATNHAWFQALHVTRATLLSARTRKMAVGNSQDEFVKLSVSAAPGGLLLLEADRLGTVVLHADEVQELFGERVDPEVAREARNRAALKAAAHARALKVGVGSRAAARAKRQMRALEQRTANRGRVRPTKEHAEVLLGELVLVTMADGRGARPTVTRLAARRAGVQARFDRECAVVTMQRCQRGLSHRAKCRRMRQRAAARAAQASHLEEQLASRHHLRAFRYRAVARVQGVWRGLSFRARWKVETRAATVCQALGRGYVVRLRAADERERQRIGLVTHRVFLRGHCVSGRYLALEIIRCGKSFKFVGTDMEECCEYFGMLTGTELHERRVPLHDAVDYILRGVALVDAVGASTAELRAEDPTRKVLVVDPRTMARATGEGVQGKRKQPNLLPDEKEAARVLRGTRHQTAIAVAMAQRDRAARYYKSLEELYAELKPLPDESLRLELTTQHGVPPAELAAQLAAVSGAEVPDWEGLHAELATRCARERLLKAFRKKAAVLSVAEMKRVLVMSGGKFAELSHHEMGCTDLDLERKAALGDKVGLCWQTQCERVNLEWGSGGTRKAFSWRGDYESASDKHKKLIQPQADREKKAKKKAAAAAAAAR